MVNSRRCTSNRKVILDARVIAPHAATGPPGTQFVLRPSVRKLENLAIRFRWNNFLPSVYLSAHLISIVITLSTSVFAALAHSIKTERKKATETREKREKGKKEERRRKRTRVNKRARGSKPAIGVGKFPRVKRRYFHVTAQLRKWNLLLPRDDDDDVAHSHFT